MYHKTRPSVLSNAAYMMLFSISLLNINLGSRQGNLAISSIELKIGFNATFFVVASHCGRFSNLLRSVNGFLLDDIGIRTVIRPSIH